MDPVTLALAKSWAEGEFGDLRQLQQHIAALQAVSGLAPITDDLQAVSELASVVEELQAVSGLAPVVGELQAVSELAPYVQAILDSRIVEMGSNSNGEYVRWESGWQICRATINVSSITPSTETVQTVTNYYYTYTWTYPATFASEPSCIAKVDTFGARSFETMGHGPPLVSNWEVEVQALKTFSSMHLMLMAIGRWK